MQLNNLKARVRTKCNGKTQNNINEIISWSEARTEIPDDPDQVFCGGIDYAIDEDNKDQLVKLRVFFQRLGYCR